MRLRTRLCAARRRARANATALASLIGALLAAFIVAGCTTTPTPTRPAEPVAPVAPPPVALDAVPGFASDPLDDLGIAITQQCAMARPPAPWASLCPTLPAADAAALRAWLLARFQARELVDADAPDGLVTGYYEPLLTGSLVRERPTQVPLRGRPPDLLTIDLAEVEPRLKGMRLRGRVEGQKVVPYDSRAQTERREARDGPGATPVVAWADDPVDAFFLEIQGSGRVRLRDGREIRVGYADQNGHPYRAIGRTLIDRGALDREAVTAPAIRRWLQQNPANAPEVMQSNPSLVYFRPLPPPPNPSLGPPGSLGVALTPMRSIAVDRSRIPLGSLVFIATSDPVTGRPLARLTVAQDTGGAIRGTKRADLFWGFGAAAGEAAGAMKAPARMWLLEPRSGMGN